MNAQNNVFHMNKNSRKQKLTQNTENRNLQTGNKEAMTFQTVKNLNSVHIICNFLVV
jgi:hypothetical protein